MPLLYSTLVFDLDGTLSDPLQGIHRCMNYALTSFDLPPRSEAEIAPFIGPPLEVAIRALSGWHDESRVLDLVARYRERYGELGYAENTIYPGIVETLQDLKDLGFTLGVCTSKFEPYANKVLENLGIDHYFAFVSGGDVNIKKTHQLQRLLRSETIDAGALMIGDRSVDLSAARDNALASCGVLWGYGDAQELNAEQPDFLINDPAQLSGLVYRA